MEPDYKADTIKGKQRAFHVVMRNMINTFPSIEFTEELVVSDGDKIIYQEPVGVVTESLINPTETFNIVNPTTGEIISLSTYEDFYVMIYSLYRHITSKRDASSVSPE